MNPNRHLYKRPLQQLERHDLKNPSACNRNEIMGAPRSRTSSSTHATAEDHGRAPSAPNRRKNWGRSHCAPPSASNCSQKKGAQRPRTSFSTQAATENQGRGNRALHSARKLQQKIRGLIMPDRRAPPSAPERSQKLGVRRLRTASSRHATAQNQGRGHCAPALASNRNQKVRPSIAIKS